MTLSSPPTIDTVDADSFEPVEVTASDSPLPARAVPVGESRLERIARRAYELFQHRGGEHGRHEEDWLAAEREIREQESEGGNQ